MYFSPYRTLILTLRKEYLSSFSCSTLYLSPHILFNNTSLSLSHLILFHPLWDCTLYAKGVTVGSDVAVIFVWGCVCFCVCGCVSESIYKGISPGGSMHRCSGGRAERVEESWFTADVTNSQLAWKPLPHLAPHCTALYLFIYLGLGVANVCSVALDISDKKDQRATPQMKLSKWPDSWVPRRTSLACTFYYDHHETSQ